jgi:hypothetical protein
MMIFLLGHPARATVPQTIRVTDTDAVFRHGYCTGNLAQMIGVIERAWASKWVV